MDQLKAVGFRVPSYMSTFSDWWKYESDLSNHQVITIDWNSRPGYEEPHRREPEDSVPTDSKFSIVKQQHRVKGLIRLAPDLYGPRVVFVGTNKNGEVRGLWLGGDPRGLVIGEGAGETPIQPHVTFEIPMPDDPTLRTITTLVPKCCDADGHWQLLKVGSVELPEKQVRKEPLR